MTPEEIKKQEAEALARVKATVDEQVKKTIAETPELTQVKALGKEVESLKEGIAKASTIEEVKKLATQLEEIGLDVKAMKENPANQAKVVNFGDAVRKSLSEQKDAIAGLVRNRGSVRLNLYDEKAAAVISSSAFGSGVLQGLRLPGIDAFERNEQNVLQEITIINGGQNSNPFSWVEKVVKEGGAASVTEGNAKPLYDWTYKENKATAETIAAIVAVSEQALVNASFLEQDINGELLAELREALQTLVVTGNGTPPNIKGIQQFATAFGPGATLHNTVEDANDYDVLMAIATQVYLAHGSASAVGVNPARISKMQLTKDVNGQYLLPPFATQNGLQVAGMRVIPMWDLSADEFLGGDLKRYMLNIAKPITVDIGWINDQFQKNQYSIRAEIMVAGGVKDQHKTKIVKGDFTSAIAYLDGAVSS